MKLPEELFSNGIAEKKVYYFSTSLISTDIPHYFICIRRTNDEALILACCTSQFETVKKFIESRNLPYETLVHITPTDTSNPFDKDTYVNCNDCYPSSVSDFITKYRSDSIRFSGEISDAHFEQILIGLHKSPLIDEEIKQNLPQPETDIIK